MKKSILTIAGAAILSFGMLHSKLLASNVTATWSYDYGPLPACSTSRPTDCIDHFELQDVTRQDKPATIQSVSNPALAVGKVDRITAQFRYGPPFGQITFSVVAVERSQDGSFISSNPYAARTTATIRPGARSALVF